MAACAGQGARVENSGTLAVNGEGVGNGLVAGTGKKPTLFNEGTVRKDEGTGMAFVEFETNNESLVKAESGNLTFDGGGGSGAEQKDKWVAEGEEAELNFSGALFTLGDLSEMRGPIYLLKSAIVKETEIEAAGSQSMDPEGKAEDHRRRGTIDLRRPRTGSRRNRCIRERKARNRGNRY